MNLITSMGSFCIKLGAVLKLGGRTRESTFFKAGMVGVMKCWIDSKADSAYMYFEVHVCVMIKGLSNYE